jgi:predicted Zn-dependent peptidase
VLADAVDAFLFGTLSELTEFDARVRAVSAAAMQQVAQRYFDPRCRVEGIVRGRGKKV